MNVLAAWQRGYTGRNVVVSILDDGIERNHPDLSQNYVGTPSSMEIQAGLGHQNLPHRALFCRIISQVMTSTGTTTTQRHVTTPATKTCKMDGVLQGSPSGTAQVSQLQVLLVGVGHRGRSSTLQHIIG